MLEGERINVNEMAGLCCVVPRVIRRWITEGRLDRCNPVKETDSTAAAEGKFAERWTLSKKPAVDYATAYKQKQHGKVW